MKIKIPNRSQFFSLFTLVTLLLVVSFLLMLTFGSIAQEDSNAPNVSLDEKFDFPVLLPNDPSASVIIEGRQIFTLKKSDELQLTAKERATGINSILEKALDSGRSPKVEIKNNNNFADIYINNEKLLTVTKQDTVSEEESVVTRASIWRDKIEDSVIKAQLERTPEYLSQKVIFGILICVLALAGNRFLNLVEQYSIARAARLLIPGGKVPDNNEENESSFFSKIKLTLAKIGLWFLALYLLTELFPQTRELRYQVWFLLRSIFTTSLFDLSNRSYSFIDLVILIGLFWGLIVAINTTVSLLKSRILNQIGMSLGSQEVISIITKYGLIAFGTVILLQVWGLNLSSVTILGSAVGVGVGIGFQDIAKNFASGLMLLFEGSVQVGDFIQVGNYMGVVQRVGARSIVLTTLDRISIIVPNSRLLADEVVNWTHKSSISRLNIAVGVAYGSDTEAVKSILLRAATEHPEVLNRPSPQVFFEGFGDSSLDFKLLVWTSDPSRQFSLKSDLYFSIEKELRESEIEIPFPQRDLHLRSENIPFSLSPKLEDALLEWLKSVNSEQ